MRIVVEGDSVPLGVGFNAKVRWSTLLGEARGCEVVNKAFSESTAEDCLERFAEALRLRPTWYVLQIGQWSMFRLGRDKPAPTVESVKHFNASLRALIEEVRENGVRVCLVTPPPQRDAVMRSGVHLYLSALRKMARAYGTALLDAHALMAEEMIYEPDLGERWFVPRVEDVWWSHYSIEGHARVAGYFNRAENKWICS